ncbi:methyl-accepting chemotaxis protein [Pseudomonas sp. S31]|nr:methyl-accepting chemotaxis protein [Pseudomonas sp. S31]
MVDLVAQESSEMLTNSAELRLRDRATHESLVAQRYFMDAYQYGKSFSQQILSLREQSEKRLLEASYLREDLTYQVRSSLQSNPEVLGLYVIFEANALDNSDKLFLNSGALGTNEAGRFSLHWRQPLPGKLRAEFMSEKQLSGQDDPSHGARYACAVNTRHECISEPYWAKLDGKQVLLISIAFPLIDDNNVLGVVGLDLGVDRLQAIAQETSQKLYEGAALVSLSSPNGVLVGHSSGSTLGVKLSPAPTSVKEQETARSHALAALPLEDKLIRTTSLFSPIPNAQEWSVSIEIPKASLLGPSMLLKQKLDEHQANGRSVIATFGISFAVVGLALMWLMASSLTRPINSTALMLKAIAVGDGDLTRRLEFSKNDELGELASWFNRFLDKLQPIISDFKHCVTDARGTADQSLAIASKTSAGMSQQYTEIAEVVTSFETMSTSVQTVASSAEQAATAARNADRASVNGLTVIDEATSSIDLLASDLDRSMMTVREISTRSEQIGSVLKVIRDIADQTNLLALNSAIEAARAGEAGRGFSVVADEVRKLAHRTQDSVSEVRKVIQDLQSGIGDLVADMQSSRDQAKVSIEKANHAVMAFRSIGNAVATISEMNLEIASSTCEQKSVAEIISKNFTSIRNVIEIVTEQAAESARISQSLTHLANHQHELVDRFRV